VSTEVNYDMSALKPGIYILEVAHENEKTQRFKIVKK
jgi:hypothetical protein